MWAAILPFLTALEGAIAEIGTPSAALIGQYVAALVGLVPTLETVVPEAVASIENIINSLKATGTLTADQITQLQTLSTQIDAQFDADEASTAPPAAPTT